MAGFFQRARLSYDILTKKIPDLPMADSVSSYQLQNTPVWRDAAANVLAPIQNRIATDAAALPIRHVMIDRATDSYLRTKYDSALNDRLNLRANIDQTGAAFVQDAVNVMLSEGVCAMVPVVLTDDPMASSTYDILSMRVGVVKQWYNRSVRVEVYNEEIGDRSEITLPKSYVALAYNPFYQLMNLPNSTLKRLIDKLALLDLADNKTSGSNLDLIIQLPYVVRTAARQKAAQERVALIEEQLYRGPYGIAYVDGAEKITQLNRAVENTLPAQVQYLYEQLYNQLGLTPSIFNGTASQEELLAYHNRTIAPIVKALAESIKTTFLSKTALSQGQSVLAFQDLFKMAPLEIIADAADKFTRNEIMSSNEFRARIGLEQKDDPKADQLSNKNINQPEEGGANEPTKPDGQPDEESEVDDST